MSPPDGPPRYLDPSSGIFRILTLVHLEGVNDRELVQNCVFILATTECPAEGHASSYFVFRHAALKLAIRRSFFCAEEFDTMCVPASKESARRKQWLRTFLVCAAAVVAGYWAAQREWSPMKFLYWWRRRRPSCWRASSLATRGMCLRATRGGGGKQQTGLACPQLNCFRWKYQFRTECFDFHQFKASCQWLSGRSRALSSAKLLPRFL